MKFATLLFAAGVCCGFTPQAHADGFPSAISFTWYQAGGSFLGTGPLMGFTESSAYRPSYKLKIKVGNEIRDGVLTLDWSWPNRIDFNLDYRGSTCPGSATLEGSEYVGSMTCPGGSHPVKIH